MANLVDHSAAGVLKASVRRGFGLGRSPCHDGSRLCPDSKPKESQHDMLSRRALPLSRFLRACFKKIGCGLLAATLRGNSVHRSSLGGSLWTALRVYLVCWESSYAPGLESDNLLRRRRRRREKKRNNNKAAIVTQAARSSGYSHSTAARPQNAAYICGG